MSNRTTVLVTTALEVLAVLLGAAGAGLVATCLIGGLLGAGVGLLVASAVVLAAASYATYVQEKGGTS